MTTSISEMEKTYVSTTKQRIEGSRFDWTMIAACTWLLTGGYLLISARTSKDVVE